MIAKQINRCKLCSPLPESSPEPEPAPVSLLPYVLFLCSGSYLLVIKLSLDSKSNQTAPSRCSVVPVCRNLVLPRRRRPCAQDLHLRSHFAVRIIGKLPANKDASEQGDPIGISFRPKPLSFDVLISFGVFINFDVCSPLLVAPFRNETLPTLSIPHTLRNSITPSWWLKV